MKRILTAIGLATLVGCGPRQVPEPADHYLRVLSLPPLALAEGERISGVRIDLTCGRFRAVNRLPNDWSLVIEGPVSERSTLTADANHGASWLSDTVELEAFVTLLVCDPAAFDVQVTVMTDSSDSEGQQTLRKDQLILGFTP